MNAHTDMARLDDPILTMLPGCHGEEYVQRRRIQSVRNIMTAKIPEMEPGHALQLAWIAIETATQWLFANTDLETITSVAEQCRRLLIVSDTAEQLSGGDHAQLG